MTSPYNAITTEALSEVFTITMKRELNPSDEMILKNTLKLYPQVLKAVNENGDTLGICAAENGNSSALKLIIENNHEVIQQENKLGDTPAIWASENDLIDALRLIVQISRSALKQKNKSGDTPTICAARKGHSNALKLMIESDQSVLHDREGNDGNTPSIWAAEYGLIEVMKQMIKVNLTVLHQKNKFGDTPAMSAAANGDNEMLKLMIQADLTVLEQHNNYGETPAYFSAIYGHCETLKLMLEYYPLILLQKDNKGSYLKNSEASPGAIKLIDDYCNNNYLTGHDLEIFRLQLANSMNSLDSITEKTKATPKFFDQLATQPSLASHFQKKMNRLLKTHQNAQTIPLSTPYKVLQALTEFKLELQPLKDQTKPSPLITTINESIQLLEQVISNTLNPPHLKGYKP